MTRGIDGQLAPGAATSKALRRAHADPRCADAHPGALVGVVGLAHPTLFDEAEKEPALSTPWVVLGAAFVLAFLLVILRRVRNPRT